MSTETTERAFETDVKEILLTRGSWKSGSNAETVMGKIDVKEENR